MLDLFKNAFWHILFQILKYVPGVQEAYDEAVAHYFRLLLESCLSPTSSTSFLFLMT